MNELKCNLVFYNNFFKTNKIIIIMHIYIKLLMMINLKTFLKTLIEKYKRIVLANRTRILEGLDGNISKKIINRTKNKISF